LGRTAQGDEASSVDEAQAVAVFRFVHVMGGHEHRGSLRGQGENQVPEFPTGDGIHTAGGFVQEEDLRVVKDGAA